MIPPTRRWLSGRRATFQSKRVRDRMGYGFGYHSMFTPSEYKKFALMVFLLFAGSVFLENELKQRIERNRVFIASLKEQTQSQLEQPELKIEEITPEEAEEERAKAQQMKEKMRRLLTVYADCSDKQA